MDPHGTNTLEIHEKERPTITIDNNSNSVADHFLEHGHQDSKTQNHFSGTFFQTHLQSLYTFMRARNKLLLSLREEAMHSLGTLQLEEAILERRLEQEQEKANVERQKRKNKT